MSQLDPARNRLRALRLGVDLTDAGAHPTVWREVGTRHAQQFDLPTFLSHIAAAQNAVFDFAVIGDSFGIQPGGNSVYQGRVDSALIASRVAPVTKGIGLVPSINVTHTEPFHVSKLVATLDYVSRGRAGWEPTVSLSATEAKLFGRKDVQTAHSAWQEAGEVTDVVRRLWDSWEDDAEIRDAATSRFVDRDKLHYVDYEGINFKVRGPSITPRPIQGHAVTVVSIPRDLDQQEHAIDVAAREADIVRIQVEDAEEASALRQRLKAQAAEHGRDPESVIVLADIFVVTGENPSTAQVRYDILRDLEPAGTSDHLTLTLRHVGTAAALAGTIAQWFTDGVVDGFVIRPAALHTDLREVIDFTIPILQNRGLFPRSYRGATFREHLGLERPANRYELERDQNQDQDQSIGSLLTAEANASA
jgi:alkanesulfonate monooxygenase SsuD/methylene tetrahydromethanopterin reductase-like flavin-dependent oxidoreductase (luciferase family)